MKKIIVCLLCACALVSGCSAPADTTLKVISYNIRLGMADDGPNSWEYRKSATPTLIDRERPDLLGIQEGLIGQIRYIEKHCPRYARLGVGRDDGAECGEIMAVFYLRERLELLAGGTFWLSETPDTVSHGWDAACNRTATWGLFRDRCSGRTICYINTHLDHMGFTARKESVKLLADQIGRLAPEGAAVVLGGDFNSPTDDPIFRPLDAVLCSARDTSPVTDRKGTFSDYGRIKEAELLDHLFYRGLEPVSFRTLDGNYGAPYISDHYPVEAVFRF